MLTLTYYTISLMFIIPFIGLLGQCRMQYLKEHKHFVYNTMLLEGTLNRYLADINQQAEQIFHRLIEEMAQKQGVT